MRASIAAPFADTCAADLRLAHGLGPLPALAAHAVTVPGGRLELRVLGASHQVEAELDGTEWSETVACLAGQDGALPDSVEVRGGPLRLRFRSRCRRLPAAQLAVRVRAVRQRCEAHPNGLVGTFAGSPLAVTALLAGGSGGGVRWLTWHAYPQTGELVETSSLLGPP